METQLHRLEEMEERVLRTALLVLPLDTAAVVAVAFIQGLLVQQLVAEAGLRVQREQAERPIPAAAVVLVVPVTPVVLEVLESSSSERSELIKPN